MAKRLAQALQLKNGGNQSELARAADCTPQAVNAWLQGKQAPRKETLALVADFLNVTPQYLMFGPPTVPVPSTDEKWVLMYLKPQEVELVTHYRESTDKGKRQLLLSSTHADKLPPGELPLKGDTPTNKT